MIFLLKISEAESALKYMIIVSMVMKYFPIVRRFLVIRL
jgi:hypothetical protein